MSSRVPATVRGFLFALAGLLLLTGCAAATAHATAGRTAVQTAASGPAATPVRTFAAFDRRGRIAVPVAATVRGRCWETSLAAPGPNAFRCFTGHTILDPCLRPATTATGAFVACVASPWSSVVRLRLTHALPAPDAPAGARAWAFGLANGLRCVASTGTAAFVHGVNLDYVCHRGSGPATLAARLVNPAGPVVTAQYARTTGSAAGRTLHRVAVHAIWHA